MSRIDEGGVLGDDGQGGSAANFGSRTTRRGLRTARTAPLAVGEMTQQTGHNRVPLPRPARARVGVICVNCELAAHALI